MKRYGEKTLTKGMTISYTSTNRIYNQSPRVLSMQYGNPIGYITEDLFRKLLKSGRLVKELGDFWYSEYTIKY